MSNVYLKIIIEKNWRSQSLTFKVKEPMHFVEQKYKLQWKQKGIENGKSHTQF